LKPLTRLTETFESLRIERKLLREELEIPEEMLAARVERKSDM
jgi:hypothetical protein